MSQTDVATEEATNPVGAQDSSVAEDMHEKALRGKDEDLNKAVVKAIDEMFAVDAWKPKTLVKFKIHCPSGQTALVKHLNTLDLLEHDLVEELDFFTRKLFPANIDASGNIEDAREQAEENIWAALRDPEKRRRFLDMTGKLMAAASVEPRIVHDGVAVKTVDGTKRVVFGYELGLDQQMELWGRPIPKLPTENSVYSGYIEFADRMAFFQELNKPLGLIEPFREESTVLLQDMARSEGDGGTAE